jgi:hypothetical protein
MTCIQNMNGWKFYRDTRCAGGGFCALPPSIVASTGAVSPMNQELFQSSHNSTIYSLYYVQRYQRTPLLLQEETTNISKHID